MRGIYREKLELCSNFHSVPINLKESSFLQLVISKRNEAVSRDATLADDFRNQFF